MPAGPCRPTRPTGHSSAFTTGATWRPNPEVPGEEHVLFQDELLVVADKPHFLPVTPGGRYARQTLLARLQRRLGIDTLVPLHRIDRETAGIVAFCVQPAHRDAYHALVRAQGLRKRYEALAHLPAAPQAAPGWQTRTSRIEEDPERFFLMREVAGAANSETRWRLAEARDSLGAMNWNPSPASATSCACTWRRWACRSLAIASIPTCWKPLNRRPASKPRCSCWPAAWPLPTP